MILPEDINPDHYLLWESACEFALAGRGASVQDYYNAAYAEYKRTGGEIITTRPAEVLWED